MTSGHPVTACHRRDRGSVPAPTECVYHYTVESETEPITEQLSFFTFSFVFLCFASPCFYFFVRTNLFFQVFAGPPNAQPSPRRLALYISRWCRLETREKRGKRQGESSNCGSANTDAGKICLPAGDRGEGCHVTRAVQHYYIFIYLHRLGLAKGAGIRGTVGETLTARLN